MRSGFRLSLAHLVLFVAVALVLNAHFTWWILHSLRTNRERLDLEREAIRLRAQTAAARLELEALKAEGELLGLEAASVPDRTDAFVDIHVEPRRASASPPLVTSAREGARSLVGPRAALRGWRRDPLGRLLFAGRLADGSTVSAVLDPQAPHRWLGAIDDRLELKPSATTSGAEPPPVALGGPLRGLAVVPDAARWSLVLIEYQRRVVMVVVEGVVFFAAMVATVIVLWTVLRREGALQRQSQNFISAVTHELKTPIAGIRVALETVLRGRVDADGQQHFLGNALADAERLSDLVEKVLEVTRYGGGAHRLRITIEDLSLLVESAVDAAARRARPRGVNVVADVAPSIQASCDAEALTIVISNLLENAVKYAQGPPPSVWATLRLVNGEAVLEIRDNGIGISEGDRERIFDAFYRAGDEVTRRTPGTGIGLYVAREIVNAHGGRLTVESEGRGKGAVFRMTLPGAGEFADEELPE